MGRYLSGSYTLNAEVTATVTVALGYTLSTTNTVFIKLQGSAEAPHYYTSLTVTNFIATGGANQTGRWFAFVP